MATDQATTDKEILGYCVITKNENFEERYDGHTYLQGGGAWRPERYLFVSAEAARAEAKAGGWKHWKTDARTRMRRGYAVFRVVRKRPAPPAAVPPPERWVIRRKTGGDVYASHFAAMCVMAYMFDADAYELVREA